MTFLLSLFIVFVMFVLCVSMIKYVLNTPVRELRFPLAQFIAVTLSSVLLFLNQL